MRPVAYGTALLLLCTVLASGCSKGHSLPPIPDNPPPLVIPTTPTKEALELREKWKGLKRGMSQDEVKRLIGEPDQTSFQSGQQGSVEVWMYGFGNGRLAFRNGALEQWDYQWSN